MRRTKSFDTLLAIIMTVLIVGGGFIFASAALGLLGRGSSAITSVVINHLTLGIGAGLVALVIATYLDLAVLRRFAPHVFVAAVVATAAVFLPHIGFEHGGGRRWIILFGASFQPSEFLKIAAICLCAAYFAGIRKQITDLRYGFVGYLAIIAAPIAILLLQPDIGTLGVIMISTLTIYFVSGAPWRDIVLFVVSGVVAIALLALIKPYVMDRVTTFLNPAEGQQAAGYQIRQSLIAVGSGGFLGRGFGQGVQKFTYLPEPMGDSIFAVIGEELGFVGGCVIIVLFVALGLRGYAIAARTSDPFCRNLAVGIATYLVVEAFINIASMLGIAPLTGIPLTFISQGGSAMLVSLFSAGLLLNVSRKGAHRTT